MDGHREQSASNKEGLNSLLFASAARNRKDLKLVAAMKKECKKGRAQALPM